MNKRIGRSNFCHAVYLADKRRRMGNKSLQNTPARQLRHDFNGRLFRPQLINKFDFHGVVRCCILSVSKHNEFTFL